MAEAQAPCMLMRGGTSKGLYFLRSDLPSATAERDRFLLKAMGSPDPHQIDGAGGANSLTSKVAIVSASSRADADIDYLFLQIGIEQATVDGSQVCGNLLAGVGPFALERRLLPAADGVTEVRIHMVNTGAMATARVHTPGRRVSYEGTVRIDGVPGTAAPLPLSFHGIEGSSCGTLLPTGNPVDRVEGLEVTLIDNGMPMVLVRANDLGLLGDEAPSTLEANASLKATVEKLRLACGPLMGLGDVRSKSVPKISLVSAPRRGGHVTTRTFIPHTVHSAIGVLAAVTVATGCRLPGSVCEGVARADEDSDWLDIEHLGGSLAVEIAWAADGSGIERVSLMRTCRKLFDGIVFTTATQGAANHGD